MRHAVCGYWRDVAARVTPVWPAGHALILRAHRRELMEQVLEHVAVLRLAVKRAFGPVHVDVGRLLMLHDAQQLVQLAE